ncbi:MAG: hypothetical protein ACF8Q5_03375 [Phycisphaerales bacterium JB040]
MIVGMMLSYLLVLVGGLLTLGLAGNAIWRAVVAPGGLPRDGGACGSCGYELNTLASGRCSECGADLLKSGVNTRYTMIRTAGSLPAALMGWTVIMIALSSVVLMVGSAMLAVSNAGGMAGGTQALVTSQTFRPMRSIQGEDGRMRRSADYEVAVAFDGEFSWGGSASAGLVTIDVSGDDVATEVSLEYDLGLDSYTVTDAGGTVLEEGVGYDGIDAERLIELAGLDITDPAIGAEAVQVGELFESVRDNPQNFEVLGLMNSTPAQGGLSNSGGTSSFGGFPGTNPFSVSRAEMIVGGAAVGLLLLVYLAGVVFIVRRRSAVMRRTRAPG